MLKKIMIMCVVMVAGITAIHAQSIAPQPAESLSLKELSYDFGRISQGRPVTHVFELTNTGKTPLVLNTVQASCGCTTPEWSQEPVAPGASSEIKVGFNAASEGHFSKTITITYNTDQNKTISISGNVYKTPATSAPLNPSLSLIKQTNQ